MRDVKYKMKLAQCAAMLPDLPFSCFLYLFLKLFSLLKSKFNKDSKNVFKAVIFLLQIIL